MTEKIEIGDIIKLKKQHPCGGYEWEVLRVGTDLRIKCTTCERQVWLPRREVLRRLKKIVSRNEEQGVQ
ncbi:MAG: Uncharacterized protein XD91_0991 [Clostridiales bacterium 38_11]|nr:MAG: Uncharacterized protein XD91_0991 [Clostridiales bacterium 38_11]HBH12276.1 DUF951 domain-containing protein [Clostridiales bacterium]